LKGVNFFKIFKRITVITLVPFYLERTNSAGQHVWDRRIFWGVGGGSAMPPHPKGRGVRAFPNFRVPLFKLTTIEAERPNLAL